jgi:hypothetical protein
MFDPTSRYYALENAKLTVNEADGSPRLVVYKRRRFLPPVTAFSLVVEHTVTQGERLDNITATYLDDPTDFWRICDANLVLHPTELETWGKTILIAVPTQ